MSAARKTAEVRYLPAENPPFTRDYDTRSDSLEGTGGTDRVIIYERNLIRKQRFRFCGVISHVVRALAPDVGVWVRGRSI